MVRFIAPYLTVILSSEYFVQPLWGCNSFANFTTGFGLRPAPAAIIVMTPLGSGKIKLCERLRIIEGWDEGDGRTRTSMDGYGQWQDQ